MPKLIVTDLDGTLLRRDKTISDYTAKVFAQCRERGIKIAFATARPPFSVNELPASDIISPDACTYHNGVIVAVGDEIIGHYPIPYSAAESIVKRAEQQFPDIRIFVEAGDFTYANFTEAWWKGRKLYSDFTKMPCNTVDKIAFCTPKWDTPIEPDTVAGLTALLSNDLHFTMTVMLTEGGQFMPVASKRADKSIAVAEIAAHFDIKMSDVVAFGDDINDLEMLRVCGVGVAMDNAVAAIKETADCICESNDEDGVSKWISKNV